MAEREADRERGYEAYRARDYGEALRLLLPFADEDDADAQCAIASMYQLGLGVELDAKEAVRRYRRAADRGSALACNNLWCIYTARWYAVQQDKEEARETPLLCAGRSTDYGRPEIANDSRRNAVDGTDENS